jgi:hypothetical protein
VATEVFIVVVGILMLVESVTIEEVIAAVVALGAVVIVVV